MGGCTCWLPHGLDGLGRRSCCRPPPAAAWISAAQMTAAGSAHICEPVDRDDAWQQSTTRLRNCRYHTQDVPLSTASKRSSVLSIARGSIMHQHAFAGQKLAVRRRLALRWCGRCLRSHGHAMGPLTCCNHLCLGGGKLGQDEPRAVAERHAVGDVERLEVLGLAGRGGDGRLLGPEQRVDGGGLADVGVALSGPPSAAPGPPSAACTQPNMVTSTSLSHSRPCATTERVLRTGRSLHACMQAG